MRIRPDNHMTAHTWRAAWSSILITAESPLNLSANYGLYDPL